MVTNELILTKPSGDLREAIWKYRQEYFDFGETRINGSNGIAHYDSFDEWLGFVLAIEKDKLKNNFHASTFFSVRKTDNKIIGSIQLRHFLTPELEKRGGHIGYGIRPSERRRGYGKQQLLLALDAAKEMDIPKVLITCDKDNTASGRTAESCGGVLDHEEMYEEKMQQYFWIDLS